MKFQKYSLWLQLNGWLLLVGCWVWCSLYNSSSLFIVFISECMFLLSIVELLDMLVVMNFVMVMVRFLISVVIIILFDDVCVCVLLLVMSDFGKRQGEYYVCDCVDRLWMVVCVVRIGIQVCLQWVCCFVIFVLFVGFFVV